MPEQGVLRLKVSRVVCSICLIVSLPEAFVGKRFSQLGNLCFVWKVNGILIDSSSRLDMSVQDRRSNRLVWFFFALFNLCNFRVNSRPTLG